MKRRILFANLNKHSNFLQTKKINEKLLGFKNVRIFTLMSNFVPSQDEFSIGRRDLNKKRDDKFNELLMKKIKTN